MFYFCWFLSVWTKEGGELGLRCMEGAVLWMRDEQLGCCEQRPSVYQRWVVRPQSWAVINLWVDQHVMSHWLFKAQRQLLGNMLWSWGWNSRENCRSAELVVVTPGNNRERRGVASKEWEMLAELSIWTNWLVLRCFLLPWMPLCVSFSRVFFFPQFSFKNLNPLEQQVILTII